MKRILLLFLPFLPYLASAQVAKDTVTVLTLAQIPAGAIRDTTNITFVQDNGFKKATFDSLYKYTRVKLLAAGAITSAELATALSNETGTGAAVFGTSPTITGATISGGSINNTPIGVSTANTGAFTTLTASGTATATKFIPTGGAATGNGMYLPATNVLAFSTNGIERGRFDANGRFGIGKESLLANLHLTSASQSSILIEGGDVGIIATESNRTTSGAVNSSLVMSVCGPGPVSSNSGPQFLMRGNDFSNSDQRGFLQFVAGNVTSPTSLAGVVDFVSQASYIMFRTASAATERMRISNAGEVNIGYGATDNGAYPLQVNGQIFATNATIATSDERYKENIQPLQFGLSIIEKLNPVTFNFITDGINNFSLYPEVGFIAQEVDRALATESYAKSIVKNADDSEPDSPMGLATSNLIPLLVKAIQEQQQQIEQLKQRITQLENK